MQHYIPPVNFGMVEVDLYRSGHPNELNFPFLEKLKLKTIIYLAPEEMSEALYGTHPLHYGAGGLHVDNGVNGGSLFQLEIGQRAFSICPSFPPPPPPQSEFH